MSRRLSAVLFTLLLLTANLATGWGGCAVRAVNGHPMHSQPAQQGNHGHSHDCPTRSHTPASCSTMFACGDQAVAIAEASGSPLVMVSDEAVPLAGPRLASIVLPLVSPPPRA